MTDRPLKLAVVGATGSVGRAVLEDLEAREIPVELRLFATARSEVDLLEFRGDELEVETVTDRSFRGCDAAILAVPAAVARELAPKAWAEGCLAIDLSGAFRSAEGVPLVVAGVNDADVAAGEARGIVATPSGPVVPLALALAPIHREAGIQRVAVTILQAASGSGRAGLRQLEKEMVALLNGEEPDPSDLSHRVGINLVPQVGAFLPGGSTDAEAAVGAELRRLLVRARPGRHRHRHPRPGLLRTRTGRESPDRPAALRRRGAGGAPRRARASRSSTPRPSGSTPCPCSR